MLPGLVLATVTRCYRTSHEAAAAVSAIPVLFPAVLAQHDHGLEVDRCNNAHGGALLGVRPRVRSSKTSNFYGHADIVITAIIALSKVGLYVYL